jgi:hypothetical protein
MAIWVSRHSAVSQQIEVLRHSARSSGSAPGDRLTTNQSACAVNTPLTVGQFEMVGEPIGLCGQYAVDPGSVRNGGEGLGEVGDKVGGGFDADRQAHQIGGDL